MLRTFFSFHIYSKIPESQKIILRGSILSTNIFIFVSTSYFNINIYRSLYRNLQLHFSFYFYLFLSQSDHFYLLIVSAEAYFCTTHSMTHTHTHQQF